MSENQLGYFKKCYDHHKSWDSICNIYRQAMSLELIWPYIKNHDNPTVEGYLAWAKQQKDPLYQFKYEQVKNLFILFYCNYIITNIFTLIVIGIYIFASNH